jgi:exopolysaccharide biosynthesis polyprenyl glycosylphosphotransferase
VEGTSLPILAERARTTGATRTPSGEAFGWLRENADLGLLSGLLVATAVFGRPFSKLGVDGVLYVTEIAVLLIALFAILRTGLGRAMTRTRQTIPVALLALLWAAGAVAALRGVSQHGFRDVIQDIGLVEYSIVLVLVVTVVDSRERLRSLTGILVVAGVAATIAYAIVANAAPTSALGSEHNPTSAVGIYLSLAVLIVAARFAHRIHVHPLLLFGAGAAALLMSVTVTRSVTLAALVSFAVLVALAPRGGRMRAAVLALVLSLLVVFGSNAYHSVKVRVDRESPPPSATGTSTPSTPTVTAAIAESFDPSAASGMNPNIRWRLAYWKFIVRESAHAPLLGTGFGHAANFRWSNILYDARVGNTADPNDVTPPHNSFLNVLYRMGLFGFIPLIGLVGVAVWRTARALRRPLPGDHRALLVGFACLLAFILVIASFNVALEGPYMGMFFWTVLAILLIASSTWVTASGATNGGATGDTGVRAPIGVAHPFGATLPVNRDAVLRRFLAAADAAGITVALVAAYVVGRAFGATLEDAAWGLLTLPGWLVLFKLYGLYDRDSKRISHSTVDDIPWLFHALVPGSLALWFFYKLAPPNNLILRQGVAFFLASWVAIFVLRALARRLAWASVPPERVLFVGSGDMAPILFDKMRQRKKYGLCPVGYVDDADEDEGGLEGLVPRLGSIAETQRIIQEAAVDRIVVVAPDVDEEALADVIRETSGLDIRISILPHVVDVLGPSVEIDDVEGITVLGVNPPALTRSSRFLKRTLDVVGAGTVLVLSLPILLVIALVIKSTSPGPILFVQNRVGRGGRPFRIFKFRTMVADAEAMVDELRDQSAHPAWLLLDEDPRITRVGGFLRRTSLDEIPQLWNVLNGEMSLVGPRPMPVDVDAQISGWGRKRLDLTPGITGPWQVLGRTSIPFEEMVKLDYLYVTNWSLWEDVRLLIHTLPVVLSRQGVN